MRTLFSCRRGALALALALTLCLTIPLAPRSYAVNVDQPAAEEIETRYTGTSLITASLVIYPSGEAECWGTVSCYRGYNADAVMRLQWKDPDGVWLDWNSWDDEGNCVNFYETDTVTLDRFYRVRVVADITDANGNWVETVSAISGTEPFPDDP